jgi:hypothetical protein
LGQCTVEKIDGKLHTRGRSFSEEECDRVDMLIDKCCDLADRLEVDIFELSIHTQEKVYAKIDWGRDLSSL